MKIVLKLSIILTLFFSLLGCRLFYDKDAGMETFVIPSKDNIQLKAEYYKVDATDKPLILLFHQARYSRGEYREIAPKLNELGFSCIAIDQRSGKGVNGIDNEAYKQATDLGLNTEYMAALPDLRAAVDFVLKENIAQKIILMGSSYSSALVFIVGTEYPKQVSGIIAFSPGQYFTYKDQQISDFAADISCPVFITSAGNEKKSWEEIYNRINSKKMSYLPDFKGTHGAKALWKENEGNEKYWNELTEFLGQF